MRADVVIFSSEPGGSSMPTSIFEIHCFSTKACFVANVSMLAQLSLPSANTITWVIDLQGCDWLPSATHRKYFPIFSSSVVDSHSFLLQDQWALWLAQLPKGMLWLDDLSQCTFFGMEKHQNPLVNTHMHRRRMYVCVCVFKSVGYIALTQSHRPSVFFSRDDKQIQIPFFP